jgi:CRP-like cAMP-binding protein
MDMDPLVYEYIVSDLKYPDQAVIIEEGSSGRWIYVVLEGRVKVMKKTASGMVTVDTLGEGEVFGEMVLLEGGYGRRSASVIADGEVKLGILDTDRLMKDYQTMSTRMRALLRSVVLRLRDMTSKVCRAVAGSG